MAPLIEVTPLPEKGQRSFMDYATYAGELFCNFVIAYLLVILVVWALNIMFMLGLN